MAYSPIRCLFFSGRLAAMNLGPFVLPCLYLYLWLPSAAAQGQPKSATAPSDFVTVSRQADADRDANDLKDALVLYRKALVLKPGWTEGWWSLGTIEYDQDDYADAARAFEKVRALDSKAGTARVMLGLCEFELGQDANALQHIEEGRSIGIADDPQLRHVMLYHEGLLLQRTSRFQIAQIQLHKLCADQADDEQVEETLGMAALRIPGKADFVKGSPGAAVVFGVGHAECLAAQKQYDKARQTYTEILASYPEYPNIHYAYGRLLLDHDDSADAIAEFEREIANDPNHVYARLEIAAAKYQVDSVGGLRYAQEAVKLDSQLPLGHFLLGVLLLDTGNEQRAIPELEIARKGYPNEYQVYFALGNAYARAGRKEDAARARATFLQLSQNKDQDSELSFYKQAK